MLLFSSARKNDAAVDRMMASIREFGFKIPVLTLLHQINATGSEADNCCRSPTEGDDAVRCLAGRGFGNYPA